MSKRFCEKEADVSNKKHAGVRKISVCMVGTGEYTTGYVHNTGSESDKKFGVVGLCMFELRRLGHVDRISMVGTTGLKYKGIRKHLKKGIEDEYGIDTSCDTYPEDEVVKDHKAYMKAIDNLHPGDAVTIFTPDDTHFDIAMYAIERGIHVLLTKPAVKVLSHHVQLVEAAKARGVFVMVEFHKRFDPIYADARRQIRALGDFGYFYSYMSQPKFQLKTFKAWAGKTSDISYYLNSHHIDMHAWAMEGHARPVEVTAAGSTGVAESEPFNCPPGTEDTITLTTKWINTKSGFHGTAVYTASWSASAKSEVHSQQRFHCVCSKGEAMVNQAHRGYYISSDDKGRRSVNPLYMCYTKGDDGGFAGHHGYGYKSIEKFVDACNSINSGLHTADFYDLRLPTLEMTTVTTAILQAGRCSLDNGGKPVTITYEDEGMHPTGLALKEQESK